MKKLCALVLTAALLFALSACDRSGTSGSSSGSGSSPASASQPAQSVGTRWPTGPLTMYVPSKEGGNTDLQARLFASGLEEVLGTTVTIINQADGSGVPCLNSIAQAEPDGNTLCLVSTRDLFQMYIQKAEGTRFTRDSFTNVCTIGESYVALFVDQEKYGSFDDFIAACDAAPGTVTVAVTNTASEVSLALLTENSAPILYGSGADAFTDVLGGHIDAAMVSLSFADQGVDHGVEPILIFSDQPNESFPDVPTLVDYDAEEAYSPMRRMLIVPAGVEKDILDQLVQACDEVIASTGYPQKLIDMYDMPVYLTGEELETYVTENIAYLDEYAF